MNNNLIPPFPSIPCVKRTSKQSNYEWSHSTMASPLFGRVLAIPCRAVACPSSNPREEKAADLDQPGVFPSYLQEKYHSAWLKPCRLHHQSSPILWVRCFPCFPPPVMGAKHGIEIWTTSNKFLASTWMVKPIAGFIWVVHVDIGFHWMRMSWVLGGQSKDQKFPKFGGWSWLSLAKK